MYLSDCPANGCIGVAFTLPASFSPQSYAQVGAPLAQCYPNQAPWNTKLEAVDPSAPEPFPPAGASVPEPATGVASKPRTSASYR